MEGNITPSDASISLSSKIEKKIKKAWQDEDIKTQRQRAT